MIVIAISIFVFLAILLVVYANLRTKKIKGKEYKQVMMEPNEVSQSKQREGLSVTKVVLGIGMAVLLYVGLIFPSGLGHHKHLTEGKVTTSVELGLGCMSNIMEPRPEYLGNRIWEVELASCKPPFGYITVYYNEKNSIIASTYAEALKFRWKVDIASVVSVIAISCVVLLFAALLLGQYERGE